MAGVDDSFREVDDVFRANGLGEMESSFSDAKMRVGPDGVYMEIFANKVLPFEVASTGTAAWQYFAKSMEHMPFRFLYQKDPQVRVMFWLLPAIELSSSNAMSVINAEPGNNGRHHRREFWNGVTCERHAS